VDQYYTGSNNTIYLAGVQYIFDSVVAALAEDESRRYSFCEISFFARWWNEQTGEAGEKIKAQVRAMVKNKQVAFLNGGWVMHDEAASHFVSMIDQTTLGHEFLKSQLDYMPRVGWQIDPFGHSNTHAWLSSEVGFDALYFGRIDYQDHDKRMAEKTMEMVWKGSNSLKEAQVFTGAFTSGNYGAPQGFCFDRSCFYCRDDPIVDDALLETYNADRMIANFIAAIEDEQKHSVGNHIMIKMGADFVYENAISWYNNIDKLIEAINSKDERFHLFYSTPDIYTEARAKEDLTWTTKTDDFFPYADCAHCYWTGYFTSRPHLKILERTSSSFLQVLRQTTAASASSSMQQSTDALVAAVSLVNHHDAITGTSKQHVVNDYTKILSKALTNAESALAQAVVESPNGVSATSADASFVLCRMANETTCAATQAIGSGQQAMDVLIYNSLPRTRVSQQVTLFVSTKEQIQVVEAATGVAVRADVFASTTTSPNPDAAPFTLVFTATNVPALASKMYQVRFGGATTTTVAATTTRIEQEDAAPQVEPLVVSNDLVTLTFSRTTGLLTHVARLDFPDVSADVSNDLAYYVSFGSPGIPGFKHAPVDARDPHTQNLKPSEAMADARDVSTQPSGVYLFRPSFPNEHPQCISDATSRRCSSENRGGADAAAVELEVVQGESIVEVRQRFSSWASQVVRLRQGSALVEFEWTVGPVPVESDGLGKEVISKFSSSLNSGPQGANEVFTDANGREFQKRIYNYRPTWDLQVHEPVAGNYYPLTQAVYLQSETMQMSILTDRSQAAASLRSGELEFMVHRRLLADDYRGMGEALNETTLGLEGTYPTWTRAGDGLTIRGTHSLLLSPRANDLGMRELRTAMDELFSPLTLLYRPTTSSSVATATLGHGLGADLPVNVQLITLTNHGPNKLLLRLGHAFALGEDASLSVPVDVDVGALLAPYSPKSLKEVTLSVNQDKQEQLKNKVRWTTNVAEEEQELGHTMHKDEKTGALVVTLRPMQIKTLIVSL